MILLAAFLIAFLGSYFMTPATGWLAQRYGFTDRPSPRRSSLLKPRLGGVAIYLAFLLAVAIVYPTMPGRTEAEVWRVIGLLAGGFVVVVAGVLDDRLDLPPMPQLVAQIAAASIAVGCGILIDRVTNPLGSTFEDSLIYFPMWMAYAFTFFWLVGSMNTINFLDGVDGLAAGVCAVAAIVLALHSWILGQLSIAVLPVALAGACLGFVPFNFYPGRLTLGTCGSLFLGFALGALAVIGGTKAATLLLVLGLPVVDTGWTILRRLAQGQSPFQGDRGHLHHRLLALGLTEPQIVLGMYGISLTLGILALVLSTRLAKLYALGLMGAGTLLLVVTLAYLGQRRLRAHTEAEEQKTG